MYVCMYSVCMYVYIYICVCVCVCVCVRACLHACESIYAFLFLIMFPSPNVTIAGAPGNNVLD